MDINYSCACGQLLVSSLDHAGQFIACPTCGEDIQIPRPKNGTTSTSASPNRRPPPAAPQFQSSTPSYTHTQQDLAPLPHSELELASASAPELELERDLPHPASAEARTAPQAQHSTTPKSEPAPTTKACPLCLETIQHAAIKCKHCGEYLDDRPSDLEIRAKMKSETTAALLAILAWPFGGAYGDGTAVGASLFTVFLTIMVVLAIGSSTPEARTTGSIIALLGFLISVLISALISVNAVRAHNLLIATKPTPKNQAPEKPTYTFTPIK